MNISQKDNLEAQLLHRIGIENDNSVDLESLERLRSAFSVVIPYENLSVLSGGSISLDPIDILQKFTRRRGGYCFELNMVFGALLADRGLAPRMHLGRVWLRDPEQVPPRNHGTNVINVNGRSYIADVGFGGRAPRCLIPLFDFGQEIDDGDAAEQPVRAIENTNFGIMVQRLINGVWTNQYSLELEPAHGSDIEVANFFQACSLTSHFCHHLFVGRFTQNGRDGLFDNRLTQRHGQHTNTRILRTVDELMDVLDRIFDIDSSGHEPALGEVLDRALAVSDVE